MKKILVIILVGLFILTSFSTLSTAIKVKIANEDVLKNVQPIEVHLGDVYIHGDGTLEGSGVNIECDNQIIHMSSGSAMVQFFINVYINCDVGQGKVNFSGLVVYPLWYCLSHGINPHENEKNINSPEWTYAAYEGKFFSDIIPIASRCTYIFEIHASYRYEENDINLGDLCVSSGRFQHARSVVIESKNILDWQELTTEFIKKASDLLSNNIVGKYFIDTLF